MSNVTDMQNMFNGSSFNKDISNWYTNNVTSMNSMFLGATEFLNTCYDLSCWNQNLVSSTSNTSTAILSLQLETD